MFEFYQQGNPDPKKQEKTAILSLVHKDENPLYRRADFRSDVALELKQEGSITEHPKDPITASLHVDIDLLDEVFDIEFMLPDDIKFPGWREVVDTRLTQFLIENLINPVQNFLKNLGT